MPIFTLKEIAEHKKVLKDALIDVALAQEHSIGHRAVKRMSPEEIRKTLIWLEQEEQALLGRGGLKMVPCIPRRYADE